MNLILREIILTFIILWANSDKWTFFLTFSKTGSNITCKLFPKETICIKCQTLFSRKNKKNILKCCLLKILPSTLSVNGKKILIFPAKHNSHEISNQVITTFNLLEQLKEFLFNMLAFVGHFVLTLVLLNPDRVTLLLQTVQIQISWLLKKPTDLDLHCLPFSSLICIDNLDQVDWLT